MSHLNVRSQFPFMSALIATLVGSSLIAGCGGADDDLDAVSEDGALMEEDAENGAVLLPLPDESTNHIVNGTAVSDGGRPFQVGLETKNGYFFCGGVLISPWTVLTAAHCLSGVGGPTNIKVRYNTLSRTGGQLLSVDQFRTHPSYSSLTYDYDIAVVRLASAFTPATNAAVIPMVDADSDPSSGDAIVSGWGQLSGIGGPANDLQQVTMALMTRATCQSKWIAQNITMRMICGNGNGPQKVSACMGDSGGPLTLDGKLVGIVSWGVSNCSGWYPSVYASVGSVRAWIDANMWN